MLKEQYRILLAEDDESTRETMVEILKMMGYQVEAASCLSDAKEVFWLMGEKYYDLLLSDIDLGDGTGYELMEYIRQRSTIPGIAVTSYNQEKDIQHSKKVGFADHLSKPLDIQKLKSAIQAVLGGTLQSKPVQL